MSHGELEKLLVALIDAVYAAFSELREDIGSSAHQRAQRKIAVVRRQLQDTLNPPPAPAPPRPPVPSPDEQIRAMQRAERERLAAGERLIALRRARSEPDPTAA